MFSAGIDAGAENTKVVIIEGERLLAYSAVPSGWDTQASVRLALGEAAAKAGINPPGIAFFGATGMGGKNTGMATVYTTDSTCSARGAKFLYPSARTVIDIGAEQSQAMALDTKGLILRYVRNDQCAAGAGAFITEMASVLELGLEDLSAAARSAKNRLTINSTCTIFAESEVISLVNEGHHINDIARAVCDAIASKATSLVRELNIEKDIIFIGGVARNANVAALLREKIGLDVIVPEEPRVVTAIGAALAALDKQI